MTEKASPAGWVVQVTFAAPPPPPSKEGVRWVGNKMPDAPSFEYFNVAIASPGEAVEATTKYLAKIKADVGVGDPSTVRQLSSAEVAALGLKSGEVKPA
jgi:hypothetical protein